MKKIVTVCLLALLIIVPAFSANNNWIGVTTGVGFSFESLNYRGDSASLTTIDYDLSVQGANYFSDTMGISYGIDMHVPFAAWGNGTKTPVDDTLYTPIMFSPYAMYMYKITLSDNLNLETGAGISVGFGSRSFDTGYVDFKVSSTMINIGGIGDVAVNYSIIDALSLRGGLKLFIPALAWNILKAGDESESMNFLIYGAQFTPYVGAVFCY